MTVQECYRILELSGSATMDELKKSYRRLAFAYHPDLHPDDPQASRNFQRLNEAYVILQRTLAEGPAQGASAASGASARNKEASSGTDFGSSSANMGKASGTAHSSRATGTGPGSFTNRPGGCRSGTGPWGKRPAGASGARSRASQEYARNERFYFRREDVLGDILKDPFARKVFDDIYRHIRREHGDTPPPRPPGGGRGDLRPWKGAGAPLFSRGVLGSIRGWLRRQMDDEKTIHLPAVHLLPGRTVRVKVGQGVSGEGRNIEIRLPKDFTIGKPIRLKGLGRRLGPVSGDLYLRILAK